ncbi:MAG: N-acetyltransferase [Dehalococcoidales bacterium]|nr:MAG: N-acetyltransferase [Dehalococcoidales bacterium]
MFTTRAATVEDIKAITDIYNEAVLTTDATFDLEPKTEEEQRAWLDSHDSMHPVLMAEQDGAVIGWASLSEWSSRFAYVATAEISLYVKEEFRGKGAGRKLMEDIMREGERVGLHTVLARIVTGNAVSIHLHESVGFERVGIMREVGEKFGRTLDVLLMQRIY